jgi:hypothetical protein
VRGPQLCWAFGRRVTIKGGRVRQSQRQRNGDGSSQRKTVFLGGATQRPPSGFAGLLYLRGGSCPPFPLSNKYTKQEPAPYIWQTARVFVGNFIISGIHTGPKRQQKETQQQATGTVLCCCAPSPSWQTSQIPPLQGSLQQPLLPFLQTNARN